MGVPEGASDISARALAAGADAEASALAAQEAAMAAALAFGGHGDAAALRSLKKRRTAAEKRLAILRSIANDSSNPTDAEKREFYLYRRAQLNAQIVEQEVKRLVYSGDMKRGQGRVLHGHEKAKLRKKAGVAQSKANELREVLAMVPTVVPYATTNAAEAVAPTAMKLKAVDSLEAARRSAEALDLLPQELGAYREYHLNIAAALRTHAINPTTPALALDSSPRFTFGVAAKAFERARQHDIYAANAGATQALPPADLNSAPANISWLGFALKSSVAAARVGF